MDFNTVQFNGGARQIAVDWQYAAVEFMADTVRVAVCVKKFNPI